MNDAPFWDGRSSESKQNKVENFDIIEYNLGGEDGRAKVNAQTKTVEAFIKNSKVYGYFLNPEGKHYSHFNEVGYSLSNVDKLFYDIFEQFDKNKLVIDRPGTDYDSCYQLMYLGVTKNKRFKITWQMDNEFNRLPRLTSGYKYKAKK